MSQTPGLVVSACGISLNAQRSDKGFGGGLLECSKDDRASELHDLMCLLQSLFSRNLNLDSLLSNDTPGLPLLSFLSLWPSGAILG